MLTSKWTLPLGKERRTIQKHNRRKLQGQAGTEPSVPCSSGARDRYRLCQTQKQKCPFGGWVDGWLQLRPTAKSPQRFALTHCACTPSRRMDTPAICFSVSSGCCRKGHFGNRNFFTRAKSPFAFPNPFLPIKLCFRGPVAYNPTMVTRSRWKLSFMTLLYVLAKQYGSAHIG